MSSSLESNPKCCWRQDDQHYRLQLDSFEGTVDPTLLKSGLHRLSIDGKDFSGKVLAVVAGIDPTPLDSFLRGDDLIVTCESKQPQQFQWQVYWRATSPSSEVLQVDAIVSLQTPLLESFPSFVTYSNLQSLEAWGITPDEQPQRLELLQSNAKLQEGLDCIVLRDEQLPWSYAEMSHPADEAETTLAIDSLPSVTLTRNIGGKFLEKGVIRRMRIRGIFLPRENDLQSAEKLFASFCAEAPPLTT